MAFQQKSDDGFDDIVSRLDTPGKRRGHHRSASLDDRVSTDAFAVAVPNNRHQRTKSRSSHGGRTESIDDASPESPITSSKTAGTTTPKRRKKKTGAPELLGLVDNKTGTEKQDKSRASRSSSKMRSLSPQRPSSQSNSRRSRRASMSKVGGEGVRKSGVSPMRSSRKDSSRSPQRHPRRLSPRHHHHHHPKTSGSWHGDRTVLMSPDRNTTTAETSDPSSGVFRPTRRRRSLGIGEGNGTVMMMVPTTTAAKASGGSNRRRRASIGGSDNSSKKASAAATRHVLDSNVKVLSTEETTSRLSNSVAALFDSHEDWGEISDEDDLRDEQRPASLQVISKSRSVSDDDDDDEKPSSMRVASKSYRMDVAARFKGSGTTSRRRASTGLGLAPTGRRSRSRSISRERNRVSEESPPLPKPISLRRRTRSSGSSEGNTASSVTMSPTRNKGTTSSRRRRSSVGSPFTSTEDGGAGTSSPHRKPMRRRSRSRSLTSEDNIVLGDLPLMEAVSSRVSNMRISDSNNVGTMNTTNPQGGEK
eukprot:scaffold1284_cov108-Cylindrotheca_fusiformis.AAC.4